MNRLSRLLFVVALGVVLALVAMVSRQRLRSPHEVLEEVRQELAQDAYDEARVLRQLGGAIRRAETMDPDLAVVQDLCSELRLLRARVLMEIGANTEAREDLEQVLFRYRPADADVRRLLVAVDRAEGDLEGALRRLSEILEQEPDYGPAWAETGLIHQLLAQGLLVGGPVAVLLAGADGEHHGAAGVGHGPHGFEQVQGAHQVGREGARRIG